MNHFRTNAFSLLPFLFTLSAPIGYAQTPAPATQTTFALPLADDTQATAAFLPTQAGDAYLIYATPTGKLGFYLMSPTTPRPTPTPTPPSPTPPPDPTPVPPPTPTTIKLIVVGDAAPPSIDATTSAYATQHGDTIATYSVAMVSEPTPAKSALHWIGLTAGKTYPYAFIANAKDDILWQGQLPADQTTLTATIDTVTNRVSQTRPCTTGHCPTNDQQPQTYQPAFRSRGR